MLVPDSTGEGAGGSESNHVLVPESDQVRALVAASPTTCEYLRVPVRAVVAASSPTC